MRRVAPIAAALALAAAGCPLPQPLPTVGRGDGATVVPPRILTDTAVPAPALVLVGTACAGATVRFDADLDDPDLDDVVEARWFVDYQKTPPGSFFVAEFPAARDGGDTRRSLAGYSFPLQAAPAGQHHVVELVVSNGFSEAQDPELPNRTARPGFETQVYRWFLLYADGAGCDPGPAP